jgi:hypothetical protein
MTVIKKLIDTKHYASALILICNFARKYGTSVEIEALRKECEAHL